VAILWLLLSGTKDSEKSLLLSGREEEIKESYLNRGRQENEIRDCDCRYFSVVRVR